MEKEDLILHDFTLEMMHNLLSQYTYLYTYKVKRKKELHFLTYQLELDAKELVLIHFEPKDLLEEIL